MDALNALVLGIVQGLTEFLPVSSSGHLVIAQALLGVQPGGGILFEVAVHVATLVAIVIFYRRRVAQLAYGTFTADPDSWRYVTKLVVGTIPAVVIALVARDWVEQQFESPAVVGVCLLTLAAGLLVVAWPRLSGPLHSVPVTRGASLAGVMIGAFMALGWWGDLVDELLRRSSV